VLSNAGEALFGTVGVVVAFGCASLAVLVTVALLVGSAVALLQLRRSAIRESDESSSALGSLQAPAARSPSWNGP
jgi:hypothetical protein